MRPVLSHKNGNIWQGFKRIMARFQEKQDGFERIEQGQVEGQIEMGISEVKGA